MRTFSRFLLIAIVAIIVLSALLFVWAMQREIDVSTPEARARQVEAMMLGCKVRLPEVMKKAGTGRSLSPDEMSTICNCAVSRIVDTYAIAGKIRPSDIAEEQTDAVELACVKDSGLE